MIHLTLSSPEAENIVYISTEDNRIDTGALDSQIRYLFEITNDMGTTYSKPYISPTEYVQEQYTYPIKYTIADRYNSFTLTAVNGVSTSNIFAGKVGSIPLGYYYYKVYECTTTSTNTLAYNSTTMPIDATGRIGKATIRSGSATGTVLATTILTNANKVSNLKISDLATGTYYLRLQSSAGTYINSALTALGITQVQAQSDNKRWLEITDVAEHSTGMTITIKSECPTGYSYEFDNGSGAYQSLVEITSKPQTNTITLAYATDSSPTLRLYDSSNGHSGSGSQVWGASNGREFLVPNPTFPYGSMTYTAWNPEMINSGGTVVSKGSFYYDVRYGSTANDSTQEFYLVQGEVAQGKLYITQGTEDMKEIRYKEYEETQTQDYVYNSSYD